jgi:DNA-binding response OmpR family regulator
VDGKSVKLVAGSEGTPGSSFKLLYLFEDYALDTDRRELRRGAAQLSMEPQVFDLLVFLVRNCGRVVSKDDLLAAVWAGGSFRSRRSPRGLMLRVG